MSPGKQSVRQVGLDRQRPRDCVTRTGQMRVEGLLSAFGRKRGKPEIRLGDAGPRQGEPRIQRDSVFVSSQSFVRTFFGVTIFIKAALQDNTDAPRRFSFRPFPPPALPPEFFLCRLAQRRHRSTDRALARRSSPPVRSGPRTRPSSHECNFPTRVPRRCQRGLSRAAIRTAVAGFAHAPVDQIRHAEFLSDLLGRRVLAFERKRGRARGHMHPRNFLQHR